MPSFDFTDRGLRAIKPGPTRVDYWDSSVPGPGLFGLRVSTTGIKTWNIVYRVGGLGSLRRYTLGQFPTKGYAEARDDGKRALAKAQNGVDPAGEKRETRDRSRDTVKALFEKYAEHVAVRRKADDFRSWDDVQRSLVRDVLPEWGTRLARDIRRRDVRDLVTRKAVTAPVAANRLHAHVSMLLSFGVEQDWLDANPAIGIKKRDEQARTRILTPAEIAKLWAYLDGETALTLTRGATKPITMPATTAATLRDVFKILLLCGQRLGETSNMTWADVDLDGGFWTIPAEDAKNKTAHRVAFSRQALQIIKTRHDAIAPSARFVFPAADTRQTSVMIWSQRAAPAISKALALPVPFTAHDLRRTMSTGLGELGVDESVIALLLNHKREGVTGKHYNLSVREAAKRAAWQQWADHVDAIVTGKVGKVIPIRGRGVRR